MEFKVDPEAIRVLKFLLPGFFAAWLFYLLTPHRKNSQFERVIEAFILTGVVQGSVLIVRTIAFGMHDKWDWKLGTWTENRVLLLAMFIALVFGLVLVACANSDFPQSRLRKWGLTKETSYPTEWLSAFTGDDKRWVILNLADKHRLMGQLDEWPNYPDAGHFVLINPTWVDEDGQPSPQKEIYKILVPVKDVGSNT